MAVTPKQPNLVFFTIGDCTPPTSHLGDLLCSADSLGIKKSLIFISHRLMRPTDCGVWLQVVFFYDLFMLINVIVYYCQTL